MKLLLLVILVSLSPFAQDAKQESAPASTAPANSSVGKLRVIATQALSNNKSDAWDNSVSVENKTITVSCATCTPAKLSFAVADVTSVSYGDAAYHHWKAGAATAVFSLGVGAIVGLVPHHRHFITIETKDKSSVALQPDKSTYRQLATLLNSATGLPIEVTQKEVNDLKGIPVQVKMQ
jgi:hypothetical protein